MSKELHPIQTAGAPAAIGPYSQAIRVGDFLFVSGQIPVHPDNGAVPEGVDAQARQAFANLSQILQAAGCSLTQVVKTTVFIRNMGDFAKINEIYSQYFRSPFPARSCVEVSALPKDVLLEIEAIAAL